MHTPHQQPGNPCDLHRGLIKRRRAVYSTIGRVHSGLIGSASRSKSFARNAVRAAKRACVLHAPTILSAAVPVPKQSRLILPWGKHVIITAKSDYGLRAVLYLAERRDRVRLREISETQHIPPSICAQIMRKLVAAEIVRSTAGQSGGYTLARGPESISVASVLAAADRDICIFRCVEDGCDCDLNGKCAFQVVLKGFGKGIADYLDALSLSDLQKHDGAIPEFQLPALTAGKAN